MYCISISHKMAKVDIREKIAFSKEEIIKFTRLIKDITNIVVLSTCNRVEFYCDNEDINRVMKLICEYKKIDISQFKTYVNVFGDENVIKHLCRVTSGIDSLIIGEDEILGQAKDAYYLALEIGDIGYELNAVFKGAITCAKKIKTNTMISKTSVSIGTLVSSMIIKGRLKNILVIGVKGNVGDIIIKNLKGQDVEILGTSRSHNTDEKIEYKDIKLISYNNRYDYISWADCVISATKSPHYTITYNEVRNLTDSEKVFIDLAVPQDIDSNIKDIARLYNIDYFNNITKNNTEIKLREIDRAKIIIDEMTDEIGKDIYFHNIFNCLGDIKNKMGKMDYDKLIYKVRDNMQLNEFKKFIDIFMG